MNKINFEAILGLFILVISFFVIIQTYKNYNNDLTLNSNFVLNSDFYNVGNLVVGSDVKINGVKVGSVKNISLDKSEFIANVELLFSQKFLIPSNSIATISSEGLVGGSYINITPGDEAEHLIHNSKIENTIDAISLEDIISNIIFTN